MTSPTRQQRGIRLNAETWMGIRLAAVKMGVSASNLVEALGMEWIKAHAEAENWALVVESRALAIREGLKYEKTPQNGEKPAISSGIAADYAESAE